MSHPHGMIEPHIFGAGELELGRLELAVPPPGEADIDGEVSGLIDPGQHPQVDLVVDHPLIAGFHAEMSRWW